MRLRQTFLALLFTTAVWACADQPLEISRADVVEPIPVDTMNPPGPGPVFDPYIADRFGVNINTVWNHAAGPVLLDYARDASAAWVRMDFNWPDIQPNGSSHWSWTPADAPVALAQQRGLKVLGTLSGTAAWANSAGNHIDHPTDIQDWVQFVRTTVRRYPYVSHWSILNEPNCSDFYGGTALQYADLVRYAAKEIRHPEVNKTVVVGEVATQGGLCADPVTWLATAINSGPQGDTIGVVAVHAYGSPQDIAGFAEQFPAMIDLYVNGGWRWPLWLTEWGAELDLDHQLADHLKDLTARFNSTSSPWWKKSFYWHLFRDHEEHQKYNQLYDPDLPEWGMLVVHNWSDSTTLVVRDLIYNAFKRGVIGCPECIPIHRHHNFTYLGHGPNHMESLLRSEAPQEGFYLQRRHAFWIPNTHPGGTDWAALYRCWHPYNWDHFLSRSWKCEGVGGTGDFFGYVSTTHRPRTHPLYRLYHAPTQDHMTTADPTERSQRLSQGWVDSSVLGYAYR